MFKSIRILIALLITVIYFPLLIAGVYSSNSAPFILDTFDFGTDAGTASPFLLNTFDIATTTLADNASGTFILDTGGSSVVTTGTVSGYITNSVTGNPAPNAVVTVWGGYSDNSDGTGYYNVLAIPPGTGYIVTCTAGGYQIAQETDIQVTAGNTTSISFALEPIDVDITLDYLFPDPNPVISEVMVGGTLYRHYLIREETSPYNPVASVPVKLSTGEYFYSEQDGIVTIAVDDVYIGNGNPGDEEEFSIVEVNYQNIPMEERDTFLARVIDRQYSRSWVNSFFGKVGVSWFSVEFEQGAEIELKEYEDDGFEGDSLFIDRQGRGTVAAGWGVQTPLNVGVSNVVQAGASAGAEIGFSVLTNDAYQFDYHTIEDMEAVAQYILFADGFFSDLDNTLIDLLAYLEEWFTGQTTLDAAYYYDSKAIDLKGSAEASAGLGLMNSQNDIGIGVQAGVGVEGHGTVTWTYFERQPEERVSLALTGTAQAGASAGIAWNNPYSANENTLEFPTMLGLQVSGTQGVEFATVQDRNTGEWLRYEMSHIRNQEFGISGEEVVTCYSIEGAEAYNSMQNSLDFVNVLNGIYQWGADCIIGNSSFDEVLFNGFMDLGDLQETAVNPPVIGYEVVASDITNTPPINLEIGVSLTGEQTISGTIGAGGGLTRQCDKRLTQRGAWYKGRHLKLEDYFDAPQVEVDYDEVVNRIVDQVPWYVKAAAYVLQVLSFILDDIEFDLGNGSSVYFTEGSLPAGLDTVNVATWGWWGTDRTRRPSDLTPRVRDIRSRIRDDAEAIYGMKYGVGGFYQFEPLGAALLDSVSLTIAYTDSEVVDLDESSLRMYWEDKENHEWVLVGGEVNIVNNTVTAVIPALQVYTLAPTLPKGRFSMTPNPPSIPADSATVCSIVSETILNNDGSVVDDGTLFTVSSSSGQIITADADTAWSGVQVEALGGQLTFDLIAWSIAYDAVVSAVSLYGTAEADTTVDFTDEVLPDAPVNVVAEGLNEVIQVTWSPNTAGDMAGYKVYYDTDAPGPPYEGTATIFGSPSPVTMGLDTSWTLTGLTNDTAYYIVVSAYDIEGNESDYSEEVIATPEMPPILPLTVNDLSIAIEGEYLYLSWSPIYLNTVGDSINVSQYTIYRSLDNPYFLPSTEDSIGFVLHPDSVYVDSNTGVNSTGFYNVKAVIDGSINSLNRIPGSKEVNIKLK